MNVADPLAERIIAQEQALASKRTAWDSLWQELADLCHPRRGQIAVRGNAADASPDRAKIAEQFDGTAMRANRTLAQGQASRITPMGVRWFAFRPPAELERFPNAWAWYARCGEITARKLYDSNFYKRAQEHYLDRGAFGTAATEVTSGKHGRGLHFRSYSIGTYSIAENSLDEVDTLYRSYCLTPKQLVEMFPDTCPECVKTKANDAKEQHTPLDVIHAIYPRTDRDPRLTDAKSKPVASVHVLKAEKIVLAESGFDEMPVAVSRWETWGDSPYGWSPGFLALPEASQANFLEKMLDVLAETAAFPRILYTANLKGDVDFRAMGLTCWDPGEAAGHEPKEWLTGGRYDIGKDRMADKKKAIEEAFFVPLFNAVSNLRSDATAEQVRAIVNESREIFHPIFAGLSKEFLATTLRRCFALLLRQGEFPKPPDEVLQQDSLGAFIADPALEYTSAMALALEQSQLANFADVLAVLSPLAENDPGVFDWIDTDKVGPLFARYKGLPESIVRSPEAIEAIRAARAQAQQVAAAEQASGAVRNLGGPEGIQQLAGMMPPQ
jgi:hypothetical protein